MNKKNLFLLFFAFIIWFVFWINIAFGAFDEKATPDPNIIEGKLQITAVNFNSSTNDWVELTYNHPGNHPLNLKNYSFGDDKIFKTIKEDFWVNNKEKVFLTLNKTEKDNFPYLFTEHKGLTATTEQIIIYSPIGRIIDVFCWVNNKPTEDELKDFQKLVDQKAWSSESINSCFSSKSIKKDYVIERNKNKDTDSKDDWGIKDKAINATNNQTNLSTIISLEEKKTAAASKTSTKKSKSTNYKNGDIKGNIIISELLPNPKGTDTGNEWIELSNIGSETINLGNWQLDDGDIGGKIYKIPDNLNIKAGESLILKSKDTKIALGNKEEKINLLNPLGNIISTVEYKEAFEEKSYCLIFLTNEHGEEKQEWVWLEEASPGQPNPRYTSLLINILSDPLFENEYTFWGENIQKAEAGKNPEKLKIIFTENIVAGPLAKVTFVKGAKLLITGLLEKNIFRLKKYEVLETTNMSKTSDLKITIILLMIAIIVGIIGTGRLLLKKKQKLETKEIGQTLEP